MDFFESMAMAGGDSAAAAGMHTSAAASMRPTPVGHRGPPPPGVSIPDNAYAIYSREGKYLGWAYRGQTP